jgi:hypothetical protein
VDQRHEGDRRLEERDEHYKQHQTREAEQQVHAPHEHGVESAAEEAGDSSDRGPQRDGDQDGQEADG